LYSCYVAWPTVIAPVSRRILIGQGTSASNGRRPDLVSHLGGDGTGGGADEEPSGGAADAAQEAAAASDAQGVVTFESECGGFLALIGEVALGRGEFGLASFAIDGEIVERLEVFSGNDGICLGRRGVW
jgi:hypothetical protein